MLRTTLRARCPRCGEGSLFAGFTRVAENCPQCAVRFDRDDTSVLAGMVIVYATSLVSTLVLAVWLIGSRLMPGRELWVLVPWLIGITVLLYRPVKAWWLWLMHRTGEMQTDEEWRAGMRQGDHTMES
jgi:uncharacterized protein (DUF983 family)